MDLHERRFLTADDQQYLDDVELALARTYRIPPEQVAVVMRELGGALRRARMGGDKQPVSVYFSYGGAAVHAEALAALLVPPRPPSRIFLGLLAGMGAAAGLLGMRVILALVFRNFAPVHIGWLDILLGAVVVSVILGASPSVRLPTRLGPLQWLGVSLVVGIIIGLGATALLHALHAQRTLFSLPLWVAAVIAAVCGALTWLLTWPGDEAMFPTGD